MIEPTLTEEDIECCDLPSMPRSKIPGARKMEMQHDEIAARLFNAYITGERDPAKLADAVIFPIGRQPLQ